MKEKKVAATAPRPSRRNDLEARFIGTGRWFEHVVLLHPTYTQHVQCTTASPHMGHTLSGCVVELQDGNIRARKVQLEAIHCRRD